jgi:hypothetical protein
MEKGWRPQATIAATCAFLIPLLAVACYFVKETPVGLAVRAEYLVFAFLLLVVVGIASAILGGRRGSKESRVASMVCLELYFWLLIVVGLCVLFLVFFGGKGCR